MDSSLPGGLAYCKSVEPMNNERCTNIVTAGLYPGRCDYHENLFNRANSSYPLLCDRIWDIKDVSVFSDDVLYKIYTDAEECIKARIEVIYYGYGGVAGEGHWGAVRRVEELRDLCICERNRRIVLLHQYRVQQQNRGGRGRGRGRFGVKRI